MKNIVLVLVLALAGVGCGGMVSIGDPDRHLVDQSKRAAGAAIAELEKVLPTLDLSSGKAVAAVKGAIQKLRVIQANQDQLQAVVGPPAKPEPYSEAKSTKSREESKESHSGGGFWGWIAGAGGTALAIAWGILRTTQAGQVIDTLIKGGLAVREKVKAGVPLTEADVKGTLAAVNAAAPPAVRAKIEATLARVKKKAAGVIPEALQASAKA